MPPPHSQEALDKVSAAIDAELEAARLQNALAEALLAAAAIAQQLGDMAAANDLIARAKQALDAANAHLAKAKQLIDTLDAMKEENELSNDLDEHGGRPPGGVPPRRGHLFSTRIEQSAAENAILSAKLKVAMNLSDR